MTVRTGSTSSSREKVVPVYKERNRENELDAGKWSQAKLGKKSHAVAIDKIRLVVKWSRLIVRNFYEICDFKCGSQCLRFKLRNHSIAG